MDKPWEHEPDFKKWRDPATGLVCAVNRHAELKHLCGYVRVPHGKLCNQLRERNKRLSGGVMPFGRHRVLKDYACDHPRLRVVDVHGGLTFGGSFKNTRALYRLERGLWLGFDCAHAGDVTPKLLELVSNPAMFHHDVYRDFEYVTGEVTSLARQIKAITDKVG